METETTEVLKQNAFSDNSGFEQAQRMALALSKSELIPKSYQGNIPSTMIALELAKRTGVSPIMVMQNLHVIQGRPSWSSSFIIAVINSYKKFSMPLNFELKGEGSNRSCVAWTTGVDGSRYESPEVNMAMAAAEGWVNKAGSKWKTMPELMLRYRAAAFFGRLYCPELLMGMQSEDEVIDVTSQVAPENKVMQRIQLMLNDCKTPADIFLFEKNNPDVDVEMINKRKEEINAGK